MVQTFLLVVIFSCQKMVIGAFTLVQCVDIANSTVLCVQGEKSVIHGGKYVWKFT